MKKNQYLQKTTQLGIILLVFLLVAPAQARSWTSGLSLTLTKGSTQMPYRLYLPANYSAAQQYPVVIFMHGSGERGNNNSAQVTYHINGLIDRTETDYPAILIAPQVPTGSWWRNDDDLTIDILQHVINTYSVDLRRIYCTGLSMGGFGTTNHANAHPHLFAAIAPFSGAYLGETLPLGHPLRSLPTWIFHGSNDSGVTVDYSRDYYRRATGLTNITFNQTSYGYTTAVQEPIRYTELAGKPHNIWSLIYANSDTALYDWMFAKVRIPSQEMQMRIEKVGTDLLLHIESDRPFADVALHTSEALDTPLANWANVASTKFDASGKTTFTVPFNATIGKNFYRATSP